MLFTYSMGSRAKAQCYKTVRSGQSIPESLEKPDSPPPATCLLENPGIYPGRVISETPAPSMRTAATPPPEDKNGSDNCNHPDPCNPKEHPVEIPFHRYFKGRGHVR